MDKTKKNPDNLPPDPLSEHAKAMKALLGTPKDEADTQERQWRKRRSRKHKQK